MLFKMYECVPLSVSVSVNSIYMENKYEFVTVTSRFILKVVIQYYSDTKLSVAHIGKSLYDAKTSLQVPLPYRGVPTYTNACLVKKERNWNF